MFQDIHQCKKAEIKHVRGPKVDERTKKKGTAYTYGCQAFTKGYIAQKRKREEIYINDAVPFCCFDGSVCAPKNKLCPNDGTPVGCINKLAPALALAVLNGGNAPGADPPPGVMTDARNGFAAPAPTPKPVAWGRSPTPIEEPPPSAVSPPGPALVKGELVGCAEGPKLPPRLAPPPLVPVPPPNVGDDDTPLKLAPSPTPTGAPTPLIPVVPAGDDTAAGAASNAGVVGTDCGIGGSASRSDAPNDDVGLKALTPAL